MRTTVAALAAATLVLGLTATPASAEAADTPVVRWNLDGTTTVMQQLPEWETVYPKALNDHDVAIGFGGTVVDGTFTTHAARWAADGTATDLGVLPGDTGSEAVAVNDQGVVVGTSGVVGDTHAVRWAVDGTITQLPGLPSTNDTSVSDIADNGTSVGESGDRAVRWSPTGTVTTLPVPAGTLFSGAELISDTGWITGFAVGTDDVKHVVRWDPQGRLRDLGAPLPDNWAVAVADDGTVAASSEQTADHGVPTHAWGDRWNVSGQLTKLPQPKGILLSYATDMNASHAVAGYAKVDYYLPSQPVRWSATGAVTKLTCDGDGTAKVINDAGVTAGYCDGIAVRWAANGTPTELTDPNDFHDSMAVDINATGNVLGYLA